MTQPDTDCLPVIDRNDTDLICNAFAASEYGDIFPSFFIESLAYYRLCWQSIQQNEATDDGGCARRIIIVVVADVVLHIFGTRFVTSLGCSDVATIISCIT